MNRPMTKQEWLSYLEQAWNAAQEKAWSEQSRREWVGLTKEERQHIWRNLENGGGPSEFADAIEAKLKEKNT